MTAVSDISKSAAKPVASRSYGDAITAAGLAAFGFVLGPFVYYGHEKIWDYYTSSAEHTAEAPTQIKLLPAAD